MSRAVKTYAVVGILFFVIGEFPLFAEDIRVNIVKKINLQQQATAAPTSLSFTDSVLITLDGDLRFLRGVELELSSPQLFLQYSGSLAVAMYSEFSAPVEQGASDGQGRRFYFEPIPPRIQTVYQLPVRSRHGLRAIPYTVVLQEPVRPAQFPLLFRILPVIKGISYDIETMRFQLQVRPLYSDEGAVRFSLRYPAGQAQQQPLPPDIIMLVDDVVLEHPLEEQLLREGQHQLTVLSEEYRQDNRRFVVTSGQTQSIVIALKYLVPQLIFEAPEGAAIFVNNVAVQNISAPLTVEPGNCEVRIDVGDYSLIRQLQIEKGKNYRISFSAELKVEEES